MRILRLLPAPLFRYCPAPLQTPAALAGGASVNPLTSVHTLFSRFSPAPLSSALFAAALCAVASLAITTATTHGQTPFPVSIQVDAAKSKGELRPIWRFFGADEPNYATMKDGQKLLSQLGELRPGDVYFRAHNMLCSGDGTPALKWGSTNIYTEDAQGNPVYDFRVTDLIFDSYIQRGAHPFAQLGFMPQALSTHPEPYRHEWRPGLPYKNIMTGWSYPPKDYNKWRELIYQWVKHCVERYGRAEVEKWYWEVWNEANGAYWHGTPQEFYKLHDYAVDGVRRALPTARVGGPHTAGPGGEFMDGFLKHVAEEPNYATGAKGTPTDFLAFHAKGSPVFVDGHVRMGISNHLRAIDTGFAKIAAFGPLKDRPIVIGESDPEGCAACQGPQNGYRNGTMYSSYTAASFARKQDLADKHGVNFRGAVTWAFEFEDQPYFAGFRAIATNGVPMPVLNVFRMFSKMSGERIEVSSDHAVPLDDMLSKGVREKPDVAAFASRDGARVAVMVWHYHDDDVVGPDAAVALRVAGIQASATNVRVAHYRIDQEHSNSYAEWKRRGSPIAPDEKVYQALLSASELSELEPARDVAAANGAVDLKFNLPRQGVSLLLLEPR
jgi:xylan 1,4-beta-xylosidase